MHNILCSNSLERQVKVSAANSAVLILMWMPCLIWPVMFGSFWLMNNGDYQHDPVGGGNLFLGNLS